MTSVVNLSKAGHRVSLKKVAQENNLKKLLNLKVGLGWDARKTHGQAFDLDLSCFLLNNNDRVIDDNHFIFYGNLKSPCSNVLHSGDDRTGDNNDEGADEFITIFLDKLSPEIKKVVFTATIYDGDENGQNFGMVENAFLEFRNADTDKLVMKCDLSEDYSTETAMIFVQVYRDDNNNDWKVKNNSEGFVGGLYSLCKNYGVNV